MVVDDWGLYSHFNSILVLAIQDLHGLDGFRDRTAASDEHTVDIEGKGEGIGAWNLRRRGEGSARRLRGALLGSRILEIHGSELAPRRLHCGRETSEAAMMRLRPAMHQPVGDDDEMVVLDISLGRGHGREAAQGRPASGRGQQDVGRRHVRDVVELQSAQDAENLGDMWVSRRGRLERGRCTVVGESSGRSGSYKNLENGDGRGAVPTDLPLSRTDVLAREILTAKFP
jgi:hypothetical protein